MQIGMEEFAERAKQLKIRAGVTNSEIAVACSADESTISRYLTGKTKPSPETAERILVFLKGRLPEEDMAKLSACGRDTPCGSVQQISAIYEAMIATLKERVDELNRRNETDRADLREQIRLERDERQRTLIYAVVVGAVSLFLTFIIVFFLVKDFTNGDEGWIRYRDPAIISQSQ